jgi:hypothetical protein
MKVSLAGVKQTELQEEKLGHWGRKSPLGEIH